MRPYRRCPGRWGGPTTRRIIKRSEVRKGKVTYEFHAKPGFYTVAAFEDENDNSKLDLGLFGPKEPAGFFRKFTAWREPTFKDMVEKGQICSLGKTKASLNEAEKNVSQHTEKPSSKADNDGKPQ